MENQPAFYGQVRSVFCEEFGGQRVQIAKYKEGELYFWCNHGSPQREKEVIDRKNKGGKLMA